MPPHRPSDTHMVLCCRNHVSWLLVSHSLYHLVSTFECSRSTSLPVFSPAAPAHDGNAMDSSPSPSLAGPPPEIVLKPGGPQAHDPPQQALAVITQTQDDSNDSAHSNSEGADPSGNEVSGYAACRFPVGADQYRCLELRTLLCLRPECKTVSYVTSFPQFLP